MKSHRLLLGTLPLLTVLVARSAVISPQPRTATPQSVAASNTPTLRVFGGRSEQQQLSAAGLKLDAALADLTRHAGMARPQQALADLHSLSPAAHFKQQSSDATPLVLIDADAQGDVQKLKSALVTLGLQRPSVFGNSLSGWLPVNQIDTAAARPELHSIRASMWRTRTGAVTSQGDFAQRSDVLRTTYPTLTGTGVLVGVISDSYNCYAQYAANGVPASGSEGYAQNGILTTAAQDVATNDLPSGITPLEEADCMNYGAPTQLPFTDEGRAMMQIVHDVAPGSPLQFYTAENGESDFASGILALQKAGAKVIADDVGYFDEPFFQDGPIAQAIDTAEGEGVAYFSAAGNDGVNAYDNLAPAFTTLSNTAPTSGEYLLNFDTSGKTNTTALPVSIPKLQQGEFVALVLQWDQSYYTGSGTGATSHLNLCVTGVTGGDQIINLDGSQVTCTGANATSASPDLILLVSNPANAAAVTAATQINVIVGLADGTTAPTRIKLAVEDDGAGAVISSFATNSPTIQGHPGAAGAAAVGAAAFYATPQCGTSPAIPETFSGLGGTPILFDTNGTRLATPVVRQKPNFVGPDGGNDTFLGFKISATQDKSTVTACVNNASYPNFFGTSAATPHAAGIAALMLQANSALTPTQIYTALQSTALPMGTTTPDFKSGYGFIQADAALATLPPGAPSLTLTQSSVTVGGTTTLTWSSINTTACTASGSWSGTQATSGSTTVTAPSTPGTATYTLTCNNAAGSAGGSATLTATATTAAAAQSSGSGGGGALDEFALLVLAGLTAIRLTRLGVTTATRS
jgi:Subtilase family